MPFVVTADDIRQALTKTDAAASEVDATFAQCPGLDAATSNAWAAYSAGYRAFSAANKDHSWFALGLPAIGDQVVAYEHELGSWQELANSKCGTHIPATVAHDQVKENGDMGFGGIDTGTKVLIGLGIGTLLVALLKR